MEGLTQTEAAPLFRMAAQLSPHLVLCLDFGLFLVLWLVQLIIYPGFLYCADHTFIRWHATYVKRIMAFVVPLMIGQMTLHAGLFFIAPSLAGALILLLILAAWTVSLAWSVPCHKKLHEQGRSEKIIRSLLRSNLVRAICWTAALLLSLVRNWPA
jgi:hypothetical protein